MRGVINTTTLNYMYEFEDEETDRELAAAGDIIMMSPRDRGEVKGSGGEWTFARGSS